MAEWHQLSSTQQQHAAWFDQIIQAEQAFFDSIKHDYDAVKEWLEDHPKVKNTAAVFGGLTALYLGKRYSMHVP